MEQHNQADLLQDIQEHNYVDPVHWIVRFFNYFFDQLAISIITNGIHYGLAILSNGAKINNHILQPQDPFSGGLLYAFLISFGTNFTYYLVFETASKGRTIGKLMTRTIAITQDGSPFTFKHALLRTLCRFIPFEPFSAFGYMPWHDSITKTVVVKKTW